MSNLFEVAVLHLTRSRKYNKFGRTYLFQLDFYHLRTIGGGVSEDNDDWQTKYVMDAYHAGNVSFVSLLLAFANLHAVHSFFGMYMTDGGCILL